VSIFNEIRGEKKQSKVTTYYFTVPKSNYFW